jgi:antitoxin component of MazEF toxin-antitoxin module
MANVLKPRDVATKYGKSEKRIRQLAREVTQRHRRWERWSWSGWDDPELTPLVARLENRDDEEEEEDEWDVALSGKNQVTLPAAAVRRLNLSPGVKIRAVLRGRSILLLPHPESWVDYLAGSLQGLYGQTEEDIDAYLREVRGDWEPNLRSSS